MSFVSDCSDVILPLSGFGPTNNVLMARRRRIRFAGIAAATLALTICGVLLASAGVSAAPGNRSASDAGIYGSLVAVSAEAAKVAETRPARSVRIIPLWNVPAGLNRP